jgi:hypothetical protein
MIQGSMFMCFIFFQILPIQRQSASQRQYSPIYLPFEGQSILQNTKRSDIPTFFTLTNNAVSVSSSSKARRRRPSAEMIGMSKEENSSIEL